MSRKHLRILQILPELHVGGVETGTVDLAKYLVQHGHHSVIVSHGGPLIEDLLKYGSLHYHLPVHKKNLWTAFRCVRALRKIIIKERIDIVHARSRVPGWIAFFATRETEAEFLTTCHGHYSTHLFSRVMGWAKLLIVPSEATGKHMVQNFKVAPENLRVIPRSVDLERFKVKRKEEAGKSTYVVTIVGRITPIKGHKYFLKAMAKVMRSMPYVKIRIVGDAPAKKQVYRQEIEVLVKRLGLMENVEFMGNRRDVPQVMAQSDVVVMASTAAESFGRVALEAQAVGVPVVATKVGGLVDIIEDQRTGLLVLPKDTDAMAEAILCLLNDKALARSMVKEAQKRLKEKFTLDRMATMTLDVYREILGLTHILVIKMSSLGDVVLITAALKALRRKYQRAQIHCLVGKESAKILQRCPYINDLIVMDPKHTDKGLLRLWKFSCRLRKYRFDKVIDFQNNWRSHLLAALSLPRESYGYDNKKGGFLLTHKVKDNAGPMQPVPHQFRILNMIGIEYDPHELLELWPSDKDRRTVAKLAESEWLTPESNIVGINLSASEKWASKNWPVEHIARLCDLLASRNIRVALTGTDADRPKAREVISLARTRPADFVGKTDLMQLAALIKMFKVYITPDSAPMHIAAAMEVPFIAMFGPTSSARHLPPANACIILERKLDCAPCYNPKCQGKNGVCLEKIMPEEVLRNIEKFIVQ